MTYDILILPEARADIEEGFNWYEDNEIGLGHQFRHAVDRSLKFVGERPFSFPIEYRDLRKAVVERFPYTLFFFVEPGRIVITACMHHKRHPRIWRSRASE